MATGKSKVMLFFNTLQCCCFGIKGESRELLTIAECWTTAANFCPLEQPFDTIQVQMYGDFLIQSSHNPPH